MGSWVPFLIRCHGSGSDNDILIYIMFRPGANARTDERFLQALPTSDDTKRDATWRDVHVDTCIKNEGTISQPKGWSENKGKKEVISTIDNSTRGRSEPSKSDDCSKRENFGRSCH